MNLPRHGGGGRVPVALVVLFGAVLLHASSAVWRPTGLGADIAYDGVLYQLPFLAGAYVCWRAARAVPAQRLVWLSVAAALVCHAVGDLAAAVVTGHVGGVPEVSIADVFYLAAYPLLYTALFGIVRTRIQQFHTSMWLDGVVGGLGAAAVMIAALLGSWTPEDGRTFTRLVSVSYPVGDALLVVLLVGASAILGLRMDRTIALFTLGMLVGFATDLLYLHDVVDGATTPSELLALGWLLAAGFPALAAQHLCDTAATREEAMLPTMRVGWRVLGLPLVGSLVSVGLLGLGWGDRFSPFAAAAAIACILAGMVRLALTFREVQTLSSAREQSLTDDLTGLPNRRSLLATATAGLAEAADERPISLLLLDLDGFKDVNDGLGHHAGDALLRQIGPRLTTQLPPRGTLGRLGGDEFAVLLPGCDLAAATAVGRALRARLVEPFTVESVRVHIDVSIGATSSTGLPDTVIEMLRRADIAMYAAKSSRAGVHAFTPRTDGGMGDRLRAMDELRTALETDELVIHLQPQVCARTGAVRGAEALVRWQHPTRGLLSPAEVLPAAAQAGLLLPLADRVLELALTAASGWWSLAEVPVSVNLAAPNVADLDLPAKVAAALARHRLPPRALTLELVEDMLMADPERGRLVLGQLRQLGVGAAIDDYGTGYSSLAYLRDLPIDELKLDRAFTADLRYGERARAIVAHTVALGHALDLRVTAEGVEDPETLDQLVGLGCDAVQGYLIARPLPVPDFREWLALDVVRRSSGAVPGS